MTSRIIWALFVGAQFVGATARAQTSGHAAVDGVTPPQAAGPSPSSGRIAVSADSTHGYGSQALRFESRWGSADIIRGGKGPVIGTVGWFRDSGIEKLLEPSPQAVTEAREFKSQNFRGSLIGGLGALTVVTGAIITSNSSNNASSPILIVAGAGAMFWGAQQLNRGFASLSRALWYYNRDLKR
jgi:hypothetical protein